MPKCPSIGRECAHLPLTIALLWAQTPDCLAFTGQPGLGDMGLPAPLRLGSSRLSGLPVAGASTRRPLSWLQADFLRNPARAKVLVEEPLAFGLLLSPASIQMLLTTILTFFPAAALPQKAFQDKQPSDHGQHQVHQREREHPRSKDSQARKPRRNQEDRSKMRPRQGNGEQTQRRQRGMQGQRQMKMRRGMQGQRQMKMRRGMQGQRQMKMRRGMQGQRQMKMRRGMQGRRQMKMRRGTQGQRQTKSRR